MGERDTWASWHHGIISVPKGRYITQPYQLRVFEERTALNLKLDSLADFIKGDVYKSLPADEQERLNRQFGLMSDYSRVLSERIAKF